MSEERTLAHQLHDVYESLAPKYGYQTRWDTRMWDPDSVNGRLMTAAVDTVFSGLTTRLREAEERAERAEAKLEIAKRIIKRHAGAIQEGLRADLAALPQDKEGENK